MTATKYKSIKVPLLVYENAHRMRDHLAARGFDMLPPELLFPTSCPRCKVPCKVLRRQESVRCPSCGYAQPRLTGVECLGLGVVLGLGTAELFRSMDTRLKRQDSPALPTPETTLRRFAVACRDGKVRRREGIGGEIFEGSKTEAEQEAEKPSYYCYRHHAHGDCPGGPHRAVPNNT